MKDIAFKPNESKCLHVVVRDVDDEKTRPLMLSVVRHVALYAHFINYNEEEADETKRNKTEITIVTQQADIIMDELLKEEYLFRLPVYGKHFVSDREIHHDDGCPNVDVDLRLQIVSEEPRGECLVMKYNDVIAHCNSKPEKEICTIDTKRAKYAKGMYELGAEIDNLPYEDIHNTERYNMALNVFQNIKMGEIDKEKKDLSSDWNNQVAVREGLSNLFCSDCFETRKNSVKEFFKELDDKDKKELKIKEEKDAWPKLNKALSKSEHARWVVEKLIMGYKPLNTAQRLEYESLFGEAKKQYVKQLKRPEDISQLSHIDLCAYADLRRIDPDNMKYDSFLMLGIPAILEKTNPQSTNPQNS